MTLADYPVVALVSLTLFQLCVHADMTVLSPQWFDSITYFLYVILHFML